MTLEKQVQLCQKKKRSSIQPIMAVQRGEFTSSFWRIMCSVACGWGDKDQRAPARTGAAAASSAAARTPSLPLPAPSSQGQAGRLPTRPQPQGARAETETPQENNKKISCEIPD